MAVTPKRDLRIGRNQRLLIRIKGCVEIERVLSARLALKGRSMVGDDDCGAARLLPPGEFFPQERHGFGVQNVRPLGRKWTIAAADHLKVGEVSANARFGRFVSGAMSGPES